MVRVMATGVFDLLHPGHVYFLEKARGLGDELIVIVARDNIAETLKYRPVNSEAHRLMMVEALKPVDKAVLGYADRKDFFQVLDDHKPEVLALGYDQYTNTKHLEEEVKIRGMKMEIIRIECYADGDDEIKATRKIIDKIVRWHQYRKIIGEEETHEEDRDS